MKKRFLTVILSAAMMVTSAAAGAVAVSASDEVTAETADTGEDSYSGESKSTVVITSLDANGEETELEVPYDPQRIAILDMACLDILDNLGLGDRVVGSASTSLDYLQDYAEDETLCGGAGACGGLS